MPYIATDLDAFDNAQGVAGAIGLPLQHVLGALALLWRWCWRQKVDRVTPEQLAAHFGSTNPALPGALSAFGFLEAVEVGAYRVRGVARYLRISEARRKGGKARAAASKRSATGQLLSSSQPAHAGHPASTPPAADQPFQRAATSEQRREETTLSAGADLFPSAPLAPTFSERDLQALWNERAKALGWPRWDAMPKERQTKAKARLREHPERAWWESVLDRAAKSAFLRGENRDGYKFNPDTLITPGRADSVLEGKYDGGGHGGKVVTTTPERKVQVL